MMSHTAISPSVSDDSEWKGAREEAVRYEQIKLLYEASSFSIVAASFTAAVLVAVQWQAFSHVMLTVWLGLHLSIALLRGVLIVAFRRAEPEAKKSTNWEHYFIIGLMMSGLLWGAAPFIMFEDRLLSSQAFLAMVAAGLSAAGVSALSQRRLPVFAFISVVQLPLLLRFMFSDSDIALAMTVMMILFFVLMMINANRIYENTRQNIVLRMQSQMNEEALKASEARFRQLFEGNRSVEIVIDPESGRIIDANPAAERFYGYAREKLLSLKISDINTLSREEVAAEMDLARSEQRNHFIFKHRLANGDVRDVEVHSGPIEWNKRQVLYSIVHDITDRVVAEGRLRKLSRAVEQAGEAVLITDREGAIEYINPAFTNITGYALSEVIGKTPKILSSGRQSAAFYDEMWATISNGKLWQRQLIDRRKSGELYPAFLSIAPIFDEKGEISHYVGIQQDMTEQELLEDKFRQAQKMEALGTLVGGIAHDFNNMLAGITGNLYLIKRQLKGNTELSEKVETIDALSFRAAEMIKQLLTFARKGSLESRPFGLTSFIREVSKLSEASIPENIDFNIHICTEELVIRGDATQLQQVMMNLLNNARDAVVDVSNPTITLALDEYRADESFFARHPESTASLFARLIVQDNGCGISDEVSEHIFEPFYTTKEVGLGTGLGLAMVYGTIQSQGGFIDIESNEGIGTRFYVYLPLVEEHDLLDAAQSSEEVVHGNGELILLCDDNANIRETTSGVLESIGYRTITASDGLEAVELYRAKQSDISIILMDVVMPRLGGVKAVERIKEINPDAQVIFATGYDRDEALKGEMPKEGFEVLSKPYGVGHLSQVLRVHLEKGRAGKKRGA